MNIVIFNLIFLHSFPDVLIGLNVYNSKKVAEHSAYSGVKEFIETYSCDPADDSTHFECVAENDTVRITHLTLDGQEFSGSLSTFVEKLESNALFST